LLLWWVGGFGVIIGVGGVFVGEGVVGVGDGTCVAWGGVGDRRRGVRCGGGVGGVGGVGGGGEYHGGVDISDHDLT
jgi:hypothetical protein